MKKILDYLSSPEGFYLTFILGLFVVYCATKSIEVGIKYSNYQNTLDKVLDCRKLGSDKSVPRLDGICGPIPQWKDYQ